MMPDKSQGGLLARLQELSGCQYLSDLHSSFYIEDIYMPCARSACHPIPWANGRRLSGILLASGRNLRVRKSL